MADYFTRFSCALPVGPGNAEAALALYEQMQAELDADDAEIGFVAEINDPGDDSLWLWDGDGAGDVENVTAFALRAAEAFDLAEFWGFHWSLTCSRPRISSFVGGAQLLDLGRRRSLGWVDCQHWLEERTGMGEPCTVLAEVILQPVVVAEGWTVATQTSVLLGFIDSLIADDPAGAERLGAHLAAASAADDDFLCRECGAEVVISDAGTSHHVGRGLDGIDHARDRDHTALPEREP